MQNNATLAYDPLLTLARTSYVPSLQESCLIALAQTSDTTLQQRLLLDTLNATLIRGQDTPKVFGRVARQSRASGQLAWQTMVDHWDELLEVTDYGILSAVSSVSRWMTTPQDRALLESFLTNKASDAIGPTTRQKLLDTVDKNIYWQGHTGAGIANAMQKALGG